MQISAAVVEYGLINNLYKHIYLTLALMQSFFETGFKLKTYIKLSVKSILAYLGVNKNGIAEQTCENNINYLN